MKVIKPQKLGLISRCFEHRRRFFLSLGVLALHRFDGALASEMDMWPFLAGELGPDSAPDAGMPKSRSEYLVSGYAYSPQGTPESSRSVHVRFGALEKTLWAYGDRFLTADDSGREVITAPEAFDRVPITWERAFGGPGFERNPLGKGFAPVQTDQGLVHPLPNLELHDQASGALGGHPEPAGLGPIDLMWPQRASKAGTYDAAWGEALSPGFAGDIDWTIFNIAPEDQQQEASFQGDEPFLVHGMHPEKPQVEGRLPGLAARCFVTLRTAGEEALHEVGMRLTTAWLFPHVERCLLIFHGLQEVSEDDAADVLHAVVAAEKLGEPRPVEHYRQVLTQRLDPAKGALYALRDADLLPALSVDEDEPDREAAATKALTTTEGLRRQYQRRRHEREVEKARAFVASRGLDPDLHGPPPLPPDDPEPSMDELPELAEKWEREAERIRQELEAERETKLQELRAGTAMDGANADAHDAGALPPPGPPRFSAQAQISMLQARLAERRALGFPRDPLDQMADDPEQHRVLVEAEEQIRQGYRQMAHHQEAAPRLAGREAEASRTAALARLADGGSLARHDLTGFDLSGLDLRGVDLSGAWLENANLAGTNLAGADLSEAVLARADLTDTDLSAAKLRKANLGLAQLVRTRADGADLSEAILDSARLDGAGFRNAVLVSARLGEAVFHAVDMSSAVLRQVTFLKSELRGVRLAGADLGRCVFLDVDVRGVDFTGASLDGATFLKASGAGARFAGASLAGACFVQDCAFEEADFREAVLERANLRGTKLTGCNFEGARLGSADLSECDLARASLLRADARDALFVRANLSDARLESANLVNALLQHADLAGTDLQSANLFQADLARAIVDAATDLRGANLKRARVHPRAYAG